MDQNLKATMQLNVAKAALQYIGQNEIIGIGTGSTVGYFIDQLATIKHKIAGAVASSQATAERLKVLQIPVFDLNSVDDLTVYIDGADAFNSLKQLIKGGGGALTREKILAAACTQFICIVDASKEADFLGRVPVPIEVIPMARSYVAREIVKLGGHPQYRANFITDNGNIILDVLAWEIAKPMDLESKLNQIAGVVSNGIFAMRPADKILIGTADGVLEN